MSNKMLPSGISVRVREDLIDGVARTQTTLIVDPLITLGGHRVTMDDIGAIGYGKIDQGKASEEIISWTGIIDNNTTYTLTGCIWGINFHNTGNDAKNIKRHVLGATFAIMTDMHYITEMFRDNDDNIFSNPNPADFVTNELKLGDGTTDTDKVITAQNGTVNEPFIKYNKDTSKWNISNDGINTFDPEDGGSGLTAGDAILIDGGAINVKTKETSGVHIDTDEVSILYQTDPGLEVDVDGKLGVKVKPGTGLVKDADGIYNDSIDPDNIIPQANAKLVGGELSSFNADILLVAGGGGGGRGGSNYSNGYGGGGGGVVWAENYKILTGTHNIVVGAGGNGSSALTGAGQNGGDTKAFYLTAKGGGGGRSGDGPAKGNDGGSGGGYGGISIQKNQVGNSGKYGYGNNAEGNGGGGAGGKSNSDSGGIGLSVWGTVYSKGGNYNGSIAGGNNTGNGGDGSNYNITVGFAGGSGIVKIRYKTADKPSEITITGGTITVDGEYTYHTFTENGDFSISGTPPNNLENFQNLAVGTNDGKFTVNIDGVEYEDVGITMPTSGNTLESIATLIQSSLRVATGKQEQVIFDQDHFEIIGDNESRFAKILKLTPPTTGTDISGIGYLDLADNATEVFGTGEDYNIVRLDKDGKIPLETNKDAIPITQTKQLDTIYQNTKNRPIIVYTSISLYSGAIVGSYSRVEVMIGSTSLPNTSILRAESSLNDAGADNTKGVPMTFIVPPWYYYKIQKTVGTVEYPGSATLISWFECDLI